MSKIIAILASLMIAFSTTAASSRVLWEANYGKFKLIAWDGEYRYCALKTFWRSGEEFGLRLNNTDGLYLALTLNRAKSEQGVSIYFDNVLMGTYRANEGLVPYQLLVFIPDNQAPLFFEMFKASHEMLIVSNSTNDINLNMSLEGTRLLGENLVSCVRRFGF